MWKRAAAGLHRVRPHREQLLRHLLFDVSGRPLLRLRSGEVDADDDEPDGDDGGAGRPVDARRRPGADALVF